MFTWTCSGCKATITSPPDGIYSDDLEWMSHQGWEMDVSKTLGVRHFCPVCQKECAKSAEMLG